MKEIVDKIPITTILISYLFICGGLYIIGFWTTFELDITSFVTLTDIPKSFILPFVLTNGFYLLNLLFKIVMIRAFKDSDTEQEPTKRERLLWKIFDTVLLATFTTAIIMYEGYKMTITYWGVFATIFTYGFLIKFVTMKALKKMVPYFDFRLYIASFLIALPIACFSIGKVTSLKIYHNDRIMTVNLMTEQNERETLKLLGFIGDKVIVSSLDNKRFIFINQASRHQYEIVKKDVE